jgi:hypothetical protein
VLHKAVALLKSLATFYRNKLMLIGYARVSKLEPTRHPRTGQGAERGRMQAHFPRKRVGWSLGST